MQVGLYCIISVSKKKDRPFGTVFRHISAFFLETGVAASAGNGDLALSLGHTQVLGTVGALEIAVLLVPADGLLQAQPLDKGLNLTHELAVLLPALGNVAGEDPENAPDKDHIPHQLKH